METARIVIACRAAVAVDIIINSRNTRLRRPIIRRAGVTDIDSRKAGGVTAGFFQAGT